MPSRNTAWSYAVFLLHILSLLECSVDCKTLHIYPFTRRGVAVRVAAHGQTNFTFDLAQSDEQVTQVVSIEPQSGDVFLISKPACIALQSNPLIAVIRSTAVSRPSERIARQLKVHFDYCQRRRKRGLFTIIPRDAAVGTRVFQLRDVITVPQGSLDVADFRLVNVGARKRFAIDRSSGYLILRKSLLGSKEHVLKVDLAYPAPGAYQQTVLARLRVFVDHRPNFVESRRRFRRKAASFRPPVFSDRRMTASVLEDAIVGTTVLTISASDPNSGRAGNLKYSMSPSQNLDSKNYFEINALTGVIKTLMSLDREKMATHHFRVRAEFKDYSNLYAQSELSINVGDVNDNSPIFEQQSYSKTVPEELRIGDPVLQVRAVDKDIGINAEIHYSFEPQNVAFRIDETSGLVTVEKDLDRETVPEYRLKVKAEDRGNQRKSATVDLRIVLSDVNDNPPEFKMQNYQITIPEDKRPGQPVLTVSATDKDQGSNSDILYDIVGGNDQGLFSINRISGEIKVAQNLDYEYMPHYSLLINAQDKGKPPQFNQATVEIDLININDNAPQFISSHFRTSVQESVIVDTVIFRVMAGDHDGNGEDVNSQIVYSITTSGVPFSVDSQTGDIKTTQKLDREKISSFTFRLKARDKGTPAKEGFSQMTVTLIDINDNPPTFKKSVYYLSVAEDSRWGTTVVKVSAEDPDDGPDIVFYTIEGDKKHCFRINSLGTVTLACRLNYNLVKHYSFLIKASDGTLDSTVVVYVNVTDSNTYSPVFKMRSYRAFVKEDVKPRSLVVEVLATDQDHGTNAKISYSFEKDVADFTIDSDSGQIKTRASLDRETQPTYSIEVSAADHGSPVRKAKAFVYITVQDVNDNAPLFTKREYTATLKENIPPPSTVITVSATDKDKGSNKAVEYSLSSKGNVDDAFEIDSISGAIRTRQKLDREKVAEYQLTVIAKDKGTPTQQSSTKVKVTVQDVFDSSPVFEEKVYIAFVKEDVKLHTQILKVSATSPDLSPPTLVYDLEFDGLPVFSIDPRNGKIQTNRPLDYEIQSEYIFKVRATSSPYFGEATVNVTLVDINDNSPVLEDFFMLINVQEKEKDVHSGRRYLIPAYDPDVADKLTFKLLFGNDRNWVNLNSTSGELYISPTLMNTMKPLTIGVQVSDGTNYDSANGSIVFTSITEEMLNNSVVVSMADISVEEFLNSGFNRLVKSIAKVVQCDSSQVLVFHMKTDAPQEEGFDSSTLKIWMVIRLKNSKGLFYGYFDAHYVRDAIYVHLNHISQETGLKLLPLKDDVCVKEVCSYGNSRKDCVSYRKFEGKTYVYNSRKVVIQTVAVKWLTSFQCSCPVDYRSGSSETCNIPINLCYSSPCGNNGKCISTEKSYACLCNRGQTGVNCEIELAKDKCPLAQSKPSHMAVNPCRNGGTCVDSKGGGFTCTCKEDQLTYTKFCELTTRSFNGNSFVAFSALKQRWRLHIRLEFTTVQQSGLLFFNGRYDPKQDFISLEIVDGQVQFTFSAGNENKERPRLVKTNVEGGVSDGKWHTVSVAFLNETGILIVDDCEVALAVQFGTREGSFGCAAATKLPTGRSGLQRSLDLNGPLMFGSLPPFSFAFPVSRPGFVGCIRNVFIDHRFYDLASPIRDVGTVAGCPEMSNACKVGPCERGNCSNIFNTFKCDCPQGYGGRKCEIVMQHTLQLTGKTVKTEDKKSATITFPWSQSLRFRTRKAGGLLIQTQFRSSSSVLEIVLGKLVFNHGASLTVKVPHVGVSDGTWHSVDVTWNKDSVDILLDFVHRVSAPHRIRALGYTTKLTIGGTKNSSGIFRGFSGCIQGIFLGQNEVKIGRPSKCTSTKHCSSNPCSKDSTCVEEWDDFRCVCAPGYVGKQCLQDICSLKPCQHDGDCVVNTGTEKGFHCSCRKEYTGELCETRLETPCREGLYSTSNSGLCGPCNCPVGKNINSVCNGTGYCSCMPNHYRLPGKGRSTDACYPCNCEFGSTSFQCIVNGGQCNCYPGRENGENVLGRRCDHCADKQGEIIPRKGCVVINTSCPRSYAEDIWWRRTSFGSTAKEKCPFGASGLAERFCDKKEGWQSALLDNCVSNSFLVLRNKLQKLDDKIYTWTPDFALQLAEELDLAIAVAPRLYIKDIETAQSTITKLFDYESQLNGSTLVSANTHKFTEILFETASQLLSPDNKAVWAAVQEDSGGTALLLNKMEDFVRTLTANLVYLKRPPESKDRRKRQVESMIVPYEVTTDNIVMQLEAVDMKNYKGVSFSNTWNNVSSAVELPQSLFNSPGHRVLKSDAAVGFVIFKNIGELLPKSFDTKIRDSKYNFQVVTDVVSVKMPGMEDIQLVDPVRIYFENQEINGSDYVCVFWNYTVPGTLGGGWSREGCKRISGNETHTVCSCDHMTAYAVLADFDLQVPVAAVFAMRIGTYIGVAISLFVLVVAFISLACLKGLQSNTNSIHKNLVGSIIIAELVFLVGINKTDDATVCRLVAILLHYFFSAVFTWMFVEGLHMYRRLREKRDVNTGNMTFYYFLGWGCPAIVVGISVGLSIEGYGNDQFCWMVTDGTLIWAFAIPVVLMFALNVIVFMMATRLSLQRSKRKRRRRHQPRYHGDTSSLRAGLRATAAVVPLLGMSLVFCILMVNKNLAMFHYLFAALACFQGLFIFVFYCLLDKTVRKEFKNAYMRWKTGDKRYGVSKPVQHYKHSYHPGEAAPLRSLYDFDDGNATSTSTTEPSSSLRSSSIGTSRPTSEPFSTAPEDEDVPDAAEPRVRIKYPGNPELELARKMWEAPEKSELSTTQPESSPSEDEEEARNSSPDIPSDSTDSENDQVPNGAWSKPKRKGKKKKKAPFYASDGPMHSTPMDTTPDEEPAREVPHESESSDTDDVTVEPPFIPRQSPKFNMAPDIIPENALVSGSAATPSDTTPSVDESLKKKPLKSALKKPRAGLTTNVTDSPTLSSERTTDKLLSSTDHEHPYYRRHHLPRHREKSRSRSRHEHERDHDHEREHGDHHEKKRRLKKKKPSKKETTVVKVRVPKRRLRLGSPSEFQDSQV